MSASPTVFFIDDSATMREVIKIAFRRENIEVVACHDAKSAITQMDQMPPDVVISDVIMPDKDGYEVCQYVKQHPKLGQTPVILMSGVVNRTVAEKAFAVKADELVRKPFQPQDLINRVKSLLKPVNAQPPAVAANAATAALSSIFAAASKANITPVVQVTPNLPPVHEIHAESNARSGFARDRMEAALYEKAAAAHLPPAANVHPFPAPQTPPPAAPAMPVRQAAPANGARPAGLDTQKLRLELLRLEGLVRKLQSELQAEREYTKALEEHIRTLQESD